MHELYQIAQKPSRLVVGLMSGTSVDGIDAALVKITGAGPGVEVELLAFGTYPLEDHLKVLVHNSFEGMARELCELNFLLGEAFAGAVANLCADADRPLIDVDLIGSHGQTIYHIPRSAPGVPSTLQLGEAAVIAERTGVPVVCDFRVRDMAAGGEGAPLVPYADFLLFAAPGSRRALQNIGGIANVTLVADRADELIAFDTGPGNMIIDALARAITGDPDAVDTDGRLSATGAVDEDLLAELLAHPYFSTDPPKTTGRELFGRNFADQLIIGYDVDRLTDLLATVVAFTADTIADAYRRFLLPAGRIDEVLVSGGGVHNATLMARLTDRLAPIPVRTPPGLDPDAKEAVAFALLANETLCGNPGNVPSATGARHPVLLGKIVPA
ncbi:MAG: anhydro-N-acetylmuramic acid kinase [Propionibacteriaceae bacterium]